MRVSIDPQWAWHPYRASDQSPWDLKKVGHLYRRAAFGATWNEVQDALKAGPQQTMDTLFKGGPGQDAFERESASVAQLIARSNDGQQATAWWLMRMLYSPFPLQEKLTLFWHNHFATSNAKVNNAGFMLRQYELIRRHAMGSFRGLLQEISRDPAMMVWLDTISSKKGMPNENYARELMELFSLGIGNYSETDIREAAKAFTGWHIKGDKAAFDPSQHDTGEKTVLRRKGPWKGEDIVSICLEQPAAARFIVGKLYRFLISETVPGTSELIEPLAVDFRKSDYDFGKLVRTMLASNLFFSPMVYRTRIKSPVDLALNIVRPLEGRIGTLALAGAMEELGQILFYPPSVKGWDGGQTWLNGQTLLSRQNLALALTSTEDARFGRRTDPVVFVRKSGMKTGEALPFFLDLFLQGDIPAASRDRLAAYQSGSHKQSAPVYWTAQDILEHRLRSLCHLVLTLPEFQLS